MEGGNLSWPALPRLCQREDWANRFRVKREGSTPTPPCILEFFRSCSRRKAQALLARCERLQGSHGFARCHGGSDSGWPKHLDERPRTRRRRPSRTGWCFAAKGSLAAGDVLLAQKIVDERGALAVAIYFSVHGNCLASGHCASLGRALRWRLQQRPPQDHGSDREIDHQSRDVDQGRDERCRGAGWIESNPLQDERKHRSAKRAE
jgi:hypothetical protein